LAIFGSESRLRTIERRLSVQEAGVSESELDELTGFPQRAGSLGWISTLFGGIQTPERREEVPDSGVGKSDFDIAGVPQEWWALGKGCLFPGRRNSNVDESSQFHCGV